MRIVPAYTPPSSFPSSSVAPPSYSAASALSLTCVVEGVNGEEISEGIVYEWVSTCPGDCFASGEDTKTVSTRYLSAGDSGVHTCKAQDLAGCKGNASITVSVVGEYTHKSNPLPTCIMVNSIESCLPVII